MSPLSGAVKRCLSTVPRPLAEHQAQNGVLDGIKINYELSRMTPIKH